MGCHETHLESRCIKEENECEIIVYLPLNALQIYFFDLPHIASIEAIGWKVSCSSTFVICYLTRQSNAVFGIIVFVTTKKNLVVPPAS